VGLKLRQPPRAYVPVEPSTLLLTPWWPERHGNKNAFNKKGLPSFATAGLCCRGKFRDRYATLTRSDGPENGAVTRA